MTGRLHRYVVRAEWTGNRGSGTSDYRSYERSHEYRADGKPIIAASSDPAFRGDPARYNPEELLVAALAGCHMLTYLHLCSDAGIVVTAYHGEAQGSMLENAAGGGRMTEVVLRPQVTLAAGDPALAAGLHERAHQLCFLASSVNFPVRCEPQIVPGADAGA